jgi:hypothetical protein
MKVRNRRDTTERGERKIALLDNFSINGGYDIARDSLNFSDIRVLPAPGCSIILTLPIPAVDCL